MNRPHLILILACAALLGAAPAVGQIRTAPVLLDQAEGLAEAGDTARAIAVLRDALVVDGDHVPSIIRLGALLARTAPIKETDFVQRQEAEKLLERAFRMDPHNGSILVEMGLLKRKQHIRVDSRRLLERALEPEHVDGLTPEAAADAHYTIARIIREELDNYEYLVFLPRDWRSDGDAAGTGCPTEVRYFCYNYTRPVDFNRQMELTERVSSSGEDLPPLIEAEYRAALSYVPTHRLASRGLLGLLLRYDRVGDYLSLADELIALNPDLPYPHLFVGLALYTRQDWVAAREAFDRGVELLTPEERGAYEDVSFLLQEDNLKAYEVLDGEERTSHEEQLWAKSDPLYIVPENERKLEHLARVAYAELVFGVPLQGIRGWETDRGLIHIRYGHPHKIWILSQDGTSTQSTEGRPLPRTGHWIFWNYRPDAPNFIFTKTLGYGRVQFDQESNGAWYTEELAEQSGATAFESKAVSSWVTLPTQVVRFRGRDPSLVEVVTFSQAPPDSFQLFEGDSIKTALFLFNTEYSDSARLEQTIPGDATGNVAFAVQLQGGRYEYSLEAFATESRVAGRLRGKITVTPYEEGQFSTSDLVISDAVVPRTRNPRRWTDFSIAASRDLSFDAGEPIHLYFELYGLTVDGDDIANYSLEITVQDAEQRGVMTRFVRGLGNVLSRGDQSDPRVLYERTVEAPGGTSPEYVSLALDSVEPGAYRIRVRVRDRARNRVTLLITKEIEITGF